MVNSSLRHASEKSFPAGPRRQAVVEGWMRSRVLMAVIAVGVPGWLTTNVSADQGSSSDNDLQSAGVNVHTTENTMG